MLDQEGRNRHGIDPLGAGRDLRQGAKALEAVVQGRT